MREHHWESIKNIKTKKGKMKRALLQFTPESMTPTRWLDPGCSWMRFVAVFQLVLIFQVQKHIDDTRVSGTASTVVAELKKRVIQQCILVTIAPPGSWLFTSSKSSSNLKCLVIFRLWS